MTNFRMIVCRECGEQIFFIRTQSGAKMPVNKNQVGYTLGGKERIVTPNGEILSVTITDHPESGLGYVPHWSTCSGANRARKVSRYRSLKRETLRKKAYFDRGEIMVEKLTANVIKKYIVDKNQPVIAADFKAKGRELVERFGVTVPEAIDILNNRKILEILCKYEDAVG